ncbi:MAG: MurR/RpiR family transcriptional regulator [Rhizomicrobium sp.]
MARAERAPETSAQLRAAILRRYEGLSKRLQQIARYVLDEPNTIALETLAVVARRTGSQPSTIVRFAKAIGFESASQMQRVFRDGLLAGSSAPGYSERVQQFSASADSRGVVGPAEMLKEFVEGNVLALNKLGEFLSKKDLKAAVRMIGDADTVYVVGFRRSLPVSSYLAYSLQQANKRTVFVDGVGGLARQQAQSIGKNDLLIAISYHPYADETVQIAQASIARGAQLLSISDSLVSPIAKPATLVLQVRESEIRKFRSLAASLCLAQTLAISYVFASTQPKTARQNKASSAGRRRKK